MVKISSCLRLLGFAIIAVFGSIGLGYWIGFFSVGYWIGFLGFSLFRVGLGFYWFFLSDIGLGFLVFPFYGRIWIWFGFFSWIPDDCCFRDTGFGFWFSRDNYVEFRMSKKRS